jgi:NhaP-type Na+/H+ or K+/H+ antiporter
LLGGAASTGEVLALLTWVVFGGSVLGRLLPQFTWPALLYAVLSLTAVRMVPVFLSLAGTGIGRRQKLFLGWFGPSSRPVLFCSAWLRTASRRTRWS